MYNTKERSGVYNSSGHVDEEKDANNMIQTVISNDLKVEELMSPIY